MDSDAPTPWKVAPTKQPQTSAWQRDDGATLYYDYQAKMMIFTSRAMADALKQAATVSPIVNMRPTLTNAAPMPKDAPVAAPATPASTNAGPYIPPGATFAPAPPASFPAPFTPSTNAPPSHAPPAGSP
jgi:hypothetical protein